MNHSRKNWEIGIFTGRYLIPRRTRKPFMDPWPMTLLISIVTSKKALGFKIPTLLCSEMQFGVGVLATILTGANTQSTHFIWRTRS